MMGPMTHGVSFPADGDGRRSSTRAGRTIVADALRPVDPVGALGAEQETAWRSGYVLHLRRLVEAGIASPEAWLSIADAGLDAVRRTLVVTDDDDRDQPLESLTSAPATRTLRTHEVVGTAEPQAELVVPYRGRELRGADLRAQLDEWVARGVMEPSAAAAVREVIGHPEWLVLPGRTVAVLGAGAEMGPLPAVLGWGGTVLAVDLPRPELWRRVYGIAEKSAGRLSAVGADLLSEMPAVARWILGHEGRLVLGDYVYAPGAAYARLAAAVDALTDYVARRRPDTAIAKLATPTDVFAVPGEAVAQATDRWRRRTRRARMTHRLSGGRLLRPNYPRAAEPGVCDSLVAQQGPNYALAKRLQRWRATVGRRGGVVGFSVAPPTRTRSVTSNRLLAAAYAGAHLFDVEVFQPATSNTLMAVLLVHQLRNPRPAGRPVWTDEAYAAAHGGLWRTAYEPRTALGLAAVRGLPTAIRR
jgi:hypothetical protein